MNRRDFLGITASGLVGLLAPNFVQAGSGLFVPEPFEAETISGLNVIDHPSPKRKTRANRLSTDYIILHTTEGGLKGSLEKNTRLGEANYMVDTNGDTYRIMNPYQISKGSGRSMWRGKTNLDNHAINIEFVGYHNRELTKSQIKNGRKLISELRKVHPSIRNEDVMPHSMVAYGRPNKWHRKSHRGRKRCGMFFATDDLRGSLGIGKDSSYDPDVSAGRLVVADPYLEHVLYGESESTHQKPVAPVEHSDEPDEPENAIELIKKGDSVWDYAGDDYADSTTVYFLNDGRVRRGDELKRQRFNFNVIQPGTRVAVGYTYGGNITKDRNAYEVAGRNWNLPSTIYRLPDGKIMTGDDISEKSIPKGTIILFRK